MTTSAPRPNWNDWIVGLISPSRPVRSKNSSHSLNCERGEFQLENWVSLEALLVLFTVRKRVRRVERYSGNWERAITGHGVGGETRRRVSLASGGCEGAVNLLGMVVQQHSAPLV
jgi:hypothetical protein